MVLVLVSDLSGPDAIRLQAAVPGIDVDEHRSPYDDLVEFQPITGLPAEQEVTSSAARK